MSFEVFPYYVVPQNSRKEFEEFAWGRTNSNSEHGYNASRAAYSNATTQLYLVDSEDLDNETRREYPYMYSVTSDRIHGRMSFHSGICATTANGHSPYLVTKNTWSNTSKRWQQKNNQEISPYFIDKIFTQQMRRLVYIADFFIKNEYHNCGLGSLLLKEALDYFNAWYGVGMSWYKVYGITTNPAMLRIAEKCGGKVSEDYISYSYSKRKEFVNMHSCSISTVQTAYQDGCTVRKPMYTLSDDLLITNIDDKPLALSLPGRRLRITEELNGHTPINGQIVSFVEHGLSKIEVHEVIKALSTIHSLFRWSTLFLPQDYENIETSIIEKKDITLFSVPIL